MDLTMQGYELLEKGDYKGAIKLLDKAIQKDADCLEAYPLKSIALDKLGMHAESLECSQTGLKKCNHTLYTTKPARDRLVHILGMARFFSTNVAVQLETLGRFEEAVGAYAGLLKIDPKDHTAHRRMGDSLEKLGRFEDAIKAYDMAAKANPQDHTAYISKAGILEDMGRHIEAASCYEEAIRALPKEAYIRDEKTRRSKTSYINAHAGRAISLLKAGKTLEAIPLLDSLIKREPKYPTAHIWRGMAMRTLGKMDEAIESLGTAIKISPGDPAPYHAMAECLARTGKTKEAMKYYDKRIEIDGGTADILYRKAMLHLGQGDMDSCMRFLDVAVSMDSGHEEAQDTKARLAIVYYKKTGEKHALDAALEALDGISKIRPKEGAPHFQKGMLLALANDTLKSLECFERAQNLSPGHIPTIHNRGMVLLKLGRHKEARICFDCILEIEPANARAHYRMGTIAESTRMYAEAQKHYERALKEKPDYEDARTAKVRAARLVKLGS